MEKLTPEYFFDLSSFRHSALFDKEDYVWKALENLENYLKSLALGRIDVEIPSGAFLVDPHLISIGPGTVVEPGAYIKGPCVIGGNCTVRQGAYIRGNLLTGDRCVIGHDTEVKHALFFDGAHAAHFAYVGDSILGSRANLGAGTKCANLKFDHQKIVIDMEGRQIDSGLRKFGAVIGDGSQIGCNAVTNPGTLMGKEVWCYPCVNVGGFIASRALVKNETRLSIRERRASG